MSTIRPTIFVAIVTAILILGTAYTAGALVTNYLYPTSQVTEVNGHTDGGFAFGGYGADAGAAHQGPGRTDAGGYAYGGYPHKKKPPAHPSGVQERTPRGAA